MATKPKKEKTQRALSDAEKKLATLKKLDNPTDAQKKEIAALNHTVKAERFSRLAKKRVGKALQMIGLVGNLSGNGYAYTAEQVAKVETLLSDAVKATIAKFAPGQAKAKQAEIEI